MSARQVASFRLNTGADIPAVGLGTWQAQGESCRSAVRAAIAAGYRHVDCAHLYGNEVEVGLGLCDALADDPSLRREHLFLTSKVLFDVGSSSAAAAARRVVQAAQASLRNLGLEYLDLLLLHWPPPTNSRHDGDPTDPARPPAPPPVRLLRDAWTAMEEQLLGTGLVRAIGVSNFDAAMLSYLLSFAKVVPAVNQLELHPLWRQERLVKFCQARGIHVSAHTPLGVPGSSEDGKQEVLFSPRFSRSVSVHRPLLKNSHVAQVAQKLNKSPAQVLLRWGLQRGTSVIPRSLHPERIRSNIDILEWSISKHDWELINSMEPQFSLNTHTTDSFGHDWFRHQDDEKEELQSVDETEDATHIVTS